VHRPEVDRDELVALQDGVVARRQLLELGTSRHEIRCLLRRKELVPAHAGVYVNHNGPLTRSQREWVAVLACWPAALSHESVLERGRDGVVHVAVDMRRSIDAPKGVVVHRMSRFEDRVRWNASPPVVRFEHAAIDVALKQPDVAALFRVLADALQSRRTTVARLEDAVASRPRLRSRALLEDLLGDLATGACSVLEREYLGLERSHGLPSGKPDVTRQHPAPSASRSRYQDVRYEPFGVAVELDGRAFHDNAKGRDADATRDLDHAVATDGQTVRLTYGQVFRDGCLTIHKVAILLQRRGWTGQPVRCSDCP
jgi:hypothetical protein